MSKNNDNINSKMQFKGYHVNKLYFEGFVDDENCKYSCFPLFSKEVIKNEDNQYDVVLGCKIESTEDNPFPFNIEVVLTGHFYIENMTESDMFYIHENAVAILFPYVRSTLSMLTLNANKNSLILPTINIVNLLNRKENE